METRVITISDIFDAITADRPYRKAIPLAQALAIMEKSRGTAIDSDCLDALHACLPKLLSTTQIVQ
jgi:HD-GYP domain-containing protein (c-di-GMP phosphodiesterase class II)